MRPKYYVIFKIYSITVTVASLQKLKNMTSSAIPLPESIPLDKIPCGEFMAFQVNRDIFDIQLCVKIYSRGSTVEQYNKPKKIYSR